MIKEVVLTSLVIHPFISLLIFKHRDMKANVLLLLLAFLSFSCNGQENEQNKEKIVPRGSWQVNKEFDENGNLKRFDSIYSWSSSGNLKGLDNDSVLNSMQSLMQKHFSMIQSPGGINFTERDSIFNQFFSNDFFRDDFFSSDLNSGVSRIDDMMRRMEAMRRHFFNDEHRYIIPPAEDDEKNKGEEPNERKQI